MPSPSLLFPKPLQEFYQMPPKLGAEHAWTVLIKGFPVIIIEETDNYIGSIKERLPVMKIDIRTVMA